MVELAGTRCFATCSEIYILQTSLYLKFLLQIATGNLHPLGAVPTEQTYPKKRPHFSSEVLSLVELAGTAPASASLSS